MVKNVGSFDTLDRWGRLGLSSHEDAMENTLRIVTLLLEQGARCDPSGGLLYKVSSIIREEKAVEIAKLLVQHGEPVSMRCSVREETALNRACRNNDLEMVRALINFGADLTVKDRYCMTPLHSAVLAFDEEEEQASP
ncbi:MAG: hypothetical protein SGARI_003208 [Bacillariaceae sp.]